jgi:hypothetical protein
LRSAKLRLELHDELLHHLVPTGVGSAERNDRIETVAELRREQPVDRLDIVAFALGRAEADRRALGHRMRPHWSS